MGLKNAWFSVLVACCLFGLSTATTAQVSSRTVTAHDLAVLTDMDGLSISPNCAWAAFQTRRGDPRTNTYQTAWVVVPTAGGAPRTLADGGEPIIFSTVSPRKLHGMLMVPPAIWTPDSRAIIYLRQDGGNAQLWMSNVSGGRPQQLTHTEAEFDGYSYLGPHIDSGFRLSADGQRLFFQTRVSTAEINAEIDAEGHHGWLFDDRTEAPTRPRPLVPLGMPMAGNPFFPGDAVDSLRGLSVYEMATHREHQANATESAEYAALGALPEPPAGQANVRSVRASSGGSLAWAEARDPNMQGPAAPRTIVARPVGSANPIACQAALCTSQFIGALMWRNDEEVLLLGADDTLRERVLYAWRPGREATPRVLLRTTGRFDAYTFHCALAQDHLVCPFEEPNHPLRLVSINLDNGAMTTLYEPNPDWERFQLGPAPQIIDVRLSEGEHLPSYLVLPPDYRPGQRLPLVIVTYVCQGFLRGGDGDEYPIYALAAQGFAVLCHNIIENDFVAEARAPAPGGPDSEYLVARRHQRGLDQAVAALAERGIIDPERVGITGLSRGSQVVEYALFNMPHLATAIASGAPMESSGFTYSPSYARRMGLQIFGADSPSSPRFDTIYLERNLSRVRAPLLINVSDQEMLASAALHNAFQDAGRGVEMYTFPGEYHIKWQPEHRLAVYNRNIDWMNFWLRGVESNLTGDASQYVRWRAMREQQCHLFGPNGTERSARPLGHEHDLTDDQLVPWYCRPGALPASAAAAAPVSPATPAQH